MNGTLGTHESVFKISHSWANVVVLVAFAERQKSCSVLSKGTRVYIKASHNFLDSKKTPQSLSKMRQFGIESSRLKTGTVKKLCSGRTRYMKHIAVSVAVAVALFVAFIYGVEFGRKVEHDAQVSAKEASAASYYSYESSTQNDSGHDVYEPKGEYDYSRE